MRRRRACVHVPRNADLPGPMTSFTVAEIMRPLLRPVVSVAVAVGLAGTSPVAYAVVESPPEQDAPTPAEESPEPTAEESPEPEPSAAQSEPPLDTHDQPIDTHDQPLDTDEPPLDTDEPLDTDDEPLDTDDDPELDGTLDRDDDSADFDDGYIYLRDSPEAKTATRWLTAGIAATVTGGVLVGGAIALGMTDPCNIDAGNNCFRDARDRAAVTMGAPGGLLLIGGVTMTIVGSLQRRRLWHRLAIAPAPSGIVVSGRF